jgi:hypothetical protein
MIVDRLSSIAYVTEDKALKDRINDLYKDVGQIKGKGVSFEEYKESIEKIRNDFSSSAGEALSEKAVIALFDYILGL